MSQEAVFTVAHNVVHLRAKPSNDSEQVSQLLMGQNVKSLREDNGWAYVEGPDTYRGWADRRWLTAYTPDAHAIVSEIFAEMRELPKKTAPLMMRIPILAALISDGPLDLLNPSWQSVTTPDEAYRGYIQESKMYPLTRPRTPDAIGAFAAKRSRDFLGTPYLWGGSSSFGLDCSGFVQLCYQLTGITLRRDADIQRDDPRFIPVEPDKRQAGDLVFFGKPDRITHVGMHLVENTFIHAAGGAGVIITEWGDGRYSPSYVDARRLDPNRAAEPITRFEADDR